MKNIYGLLLFISCCSYSSVHATEFDATINFSPRLELSLPVSGMVSEVNVAVGQRVGKGETLLALDPVPFQAAKTHAMSRLTVQQTILTQSQRDLKHQQELYDRTVLATVELENAELRVKRDRALVEDARAQLADADYALANSRLTAPFEALILSLEVNQGQSINNALQSKALVSLVRQGQYQAEFAVPVEKASQFNIGQPVKVMVQDKAYPAKISMIAYQPVTMDGSKGRQSIVKVGFAMDDKQGPVGMPVGLNARVVTE